MTSKDPLLPDLIEALIGGATSGGVGALPVFARRLWPLVVQEWRKRSSRCLEVAVDVSGMTLEDLEQTLLEDPEKISLTVRMLHYAATNGADEALLTMGAAVGSAVGPDAETSVDDAALIVEAARTLTARHVRLLKILSVPAVDEQGRKTGWTRDRASANLGGTALSAGMVLDSCVAGGTVTAHSGYGVLIYEASELGNAVLSLVSELN